MFAVKIYVRKFLVFFLLSFCLNRTVLADVDYVVLQLKGLACPFCNTHVIRVLEQTPGVQQFEADLALNRVRFYWDSRFRFQPWIFYDIVTKAGYGLEGIYLSASGTIENRVELLELVFSDSQERYLLCPSQGMQLPCATNGRFAVTGKIGWLPCGQISLKVVEAEICE